MGRLRLPNQRPLIPFWSHATTRPTITATPQQILPTNQDRVGIIFANFSNLASAEVALAPYDFTLFTEGMLIVDLYSNVELKFRDYGTLVTSAWYARDASGPRAFSVTEILYRLRG